MNLTNSISVTHPSQKVKFTDNPNPSRSEIIDYMSTSMDILDWNLKRARIKRSVGNLAFMQKYAAIIDTSGLCPEVMKSANIRKSYHVPFKPETNK